MVRLLEWIGVWWGVLTALAIGFLALLAWRSHQRVAAFQPAAVEICPAGTLAR